MASQTLQILIKAKLETDKAFKEARGGMDRLGDAAERNRGKLLAVAGGIAAIGAVSIKAAADFEKGMAEVNTLLNFSEEQVDELSDSVRELSKEFGVDAVEATKALYDTISAGVEPAKALEFLDVAARLSIAGVTDLNTAVDGLTTVVNSFGFDASEAERVADILFETMRQGKTTVGELSDFMFQAAPVSAALGVSFEEMSAAVTTLAAAGTPTRVAMTGVRQAIVSLAKPTDDMTELLDRLGFESGIAAIETLGLQGTLDALATQTGATQSEIVKAVGSVEALTTVLGITGINADAFVAKFEEIKNVSGAVVAGFEIMQETASQRLAIMQATITDLRIEIGNELLPTFVSMVEGVSSLVTKFSEMDDSSRELIKNSVLVTAALVGMGLALPPLIKAIGLLRSAVLLLNSSFLLLLANPIVAAMALIVVGLGFLTKAFIDSTNAAENFTKATDEVKTSLDEMVESNDFAELGIMRLRSETELLAATEESLAAGRKRRADAWLEQIQTVMAAQQERVADFIKGSAEMLDIDKRLRESQLAAALNNLTEEASAEADALVAGFNRRETFRNARFSRDQAESAKRVELAQEEADSIILVLEQQAEAADLLRRGEFEAVQALAAVIRSNLNQGVASLGGAEGPGEDFFRGFGANLTLNPISGPAFGTSATTGERVFFGPGALTINVEGSIVAEDLASLITKGNQENAERGGTGFDTETFE